MLIQPSPIEIEEALRATNDAPPFPPVTDRAAWAQVAETIGQVKSQEIIHSAEADAQTPIPPLTATLYLDFQRTGERFRFHEPQDQRRRMLRNMTLAECLEAQGRFLDPLLDVVWAICEESSWTRPAHQRTLTDMDHRVIDMNAALTALHLAEFDALLGQKMDPLVGKRIRYEINQRCLGPYLSRHDHLSRERHYWMYTADGSPPNNWNAVCNAGIIGAALYLEADPARLAVLVNRGLRSLADYLAGFDVDGGTTEGAFCWAYGFGYYTILAHLLDHFTGAAIDLLADDFVREIARFPLKTMLSSSHCVNFSDCEPDFSHIPAHLTYLARKLAMPEMMQLAQHQPPNFRQLVLPWGLRDLFWRPGPDAKASFVAAKRDWFQGMMWLVARENPADPNSLVLAAKGGHNGEMHNQNDLGNFIVHSQNESLLVDLGRGRFTKKYFGQGRYDYFVNASTGHSVPIVNGQPQAAGRDHAARLIRYEVNDRADLLHLDLTSAYPAQADLHRLERQLIFHRPQTENEQAWIELIDQVEFANQPGHLESVLITLAKVEIESEAVLIQGERSALRVLFDAGRVHPELRPELDIPLTDWNADAMRIVFVMNQPNRTGEIRLEIRPV